jgi:hypothetical protein
MIFFFFFFFFCNNIALLKLGTKVPNTRKSKKGRWVFATTNGEGRRWGKIGGNVARVNSSCGPISRMVGTEVCTYVYFFCLPKGRSWKKGQSVGNYGFNMPILSDRGF